jgi:hypothetical protein
MLITLSLERRCKKATRPGGSTEACGREGGGGEEEGGGGEEEGGGGEEEGGGGEEGQSYGRRKGG